MNHSDHVHLLRDGIHAPTGVWVDFGSGQGAFTLALADLLGPHAEIFSIDRDSAALRIQQQAFAARFPDMTVHYRLADFTQPLDLPPLDGIVVANALHFVRDKGPALRRLHGYLKDGGHLIVVEYQTDRGNRWVPYPFSNATWEWLARESGFRETRRLQVRPSSFLGHIYSAVSVKGTGE